ncbi:hypothetical protein CROQUDRAFT_132885 [Cronartium quercuum f. sp. fusiforme G11]|uniref:UPF3 domain-containing protein n=1 Tax=Cronartium quercuum f. sp. fusiforme G11 TaxID=708437 RepID=A0A9P6NIY6_9BASI|nr:hypothetical protein CROQUDRAFT_132885 [Cronartium quercuum f. sp. fusiforme G11]
MADRTKVVVRHLPPTLPEDVFWKTLSPWIEPVDNSRAKCQVIFKAYVPGKVRQSKGKVDLPSRAYIQFATVDDLVEFHQGYAQQAFRDSRGNITMPKIEFAPFQKIPGPVKKPDARCGTIESDQDYQAFLRRLEAPATDNGDVDADPEATGITEHPSKVSKITPLIEHLRSLRKAAQDASAAAKNPQRPPVAVVTKPPAARTLNVSPQIIKRVGSSNKPSPASAPPSAPIASSQKQNKPVSVPSPSKPSKHPKQLPPSSTTRARSPVPKPESEPHVPKSPAMPSKSSRRRQRGGGEHASTGNGLAMEHLPAESKPVPKSIVTRPKEILSKPSVPPITQQTDGQNPRTQTSKQGPQASGSGPQGGRGGGGKRGGKAQQGVPLPQGSLNSSKPNPQRSSPRPKQAENATRSEPRAPRARGTEEAAGARRRLGMALAGIAASGERRAEKRDGGEDGPPA